MAEGLIKKKNPLRVLTKIVPLVPNSMSSYIEPVQPLLESTHGRFDSIQLTQFERNIVAAAVVHDRVVRSVIQSLYLNISLNYG